MSRNPWPQNRCEVCAALSKELRDGFVAMQESFRDTWLASGRTHQDFVNALEGFLDGSVSVRHTDYVRHFQALAVVERRRREHEAATGHSVWGMLNAPGTAEALAELIIDGSTRHVRLDAFLPSRLPKLAPHALRIGSS